MLSTSSRHHPILRAVQLVGEAWDEFTYKSPVAGCNAGGYQFVPPP
jgi:hypothetical protein